MVNEHSIEYSDVIKAYQNKVIDLTNQLITSEAKVIASDRIINQLSEKIIEFEKQPKTKRATKSNESVVDYNN